ncbi:maltose acetyltransferase domain-containing protein [Levilactobacillus koreensis]|uniref:maltose acetyltransferase domain-containing protein n=1 Tax=Levilactobacillus koreensis TaxID=637971 RepID=UPI000B2006C8|nr:maltose acetyltransferase domain-containing protein [Levilactobacillus koreensis]
MMTEHEKLLAGQNYDYRDPELQRMIARGKKWLAVINTTQDVDQRSAAIQQLFGQVGQRLTINGTFSAV